MRSESFSFHVGERSIFSHRFTINCRAPEVKRTRRGREEGKFTHFNISSTTQTKTLASRTEMKRRSEQSARRGNDKTGQERKKDIKDGMRFNSMINGASSLAF
jgi:hypothetical protein